MTVQRPRAGIARDLRDRPCRSRRRTDRRDHGQPDHPRRNRRDRAEARPRPSRTRRSASRRSAAPICRIAASPMCPPGGGDAGRLAEEQRPGPDRNRNARHDLERRQFRDGRLLPGRRADDRTGRGAERQGGDRSDALRSQPRRGAARPAGYAVRRRAPWAARSSSSRISRT